MKADGGIVGPRLSSNPSVSASPNVQTRRLRVRFMTCLFVHLSINWRKGQTWTWGLNGKMTPFLCEDTGGLSSDLAAPPLQVQCSTREGGLEGRGVS